MCCRLNSKWCVYIVSKIESDCTVRCEMYYPQEIHVKLIHLERDRLKYLQFMMNDNVH